jgi:hypothetical protein
VSNIQEAWPSQSLAIEQHPSKISYLFILPLELERFGENKG